MYLCLNWNFLRKCNWESQSSFSIDFNLNLFSVLLLLLSPLSPIHYFFSLQMLASGSFLPWAGLISQTGCFQGPHLRGASLELSGLGAASLWLSPVLLQFQMIRFSLSSLIYLKYYDDAIKLFYIKIEINSTKL